MNRNEQMNCRTKEYMQNACCILKEMLCGMCAAEMDDSISGNFIRQMIPHHRAAIEMSENLLKYTDNEDLARLAQNIVAEQTAGIDCLRKVQRCCRNVTNCCTDLCEYKCRVNRIIKTMMQDIDCAYIDNSIECNFIRQMLPQQRAGLMMAKTAMCYCICDELKPVLNSIINATEKAIGEMKCISDCLDCKCMKSC